MILRAGGFYSVLDCEGEYEFFLYRRPARCHALVAFGDSALGRQLGWLFERRILRAGFLVCLIVVVSMSFFVSAARPDASPRDASTALGRRV